MAGRCLAFVPQPAGSCGPAVRWDVLTELWRPLLDVALIDELLATYGDSVTSRSAGTAGGRFDGLIEPPSAVPLVS